MAQQPTWAQVVKIDSVGSDSLPTAERIFAEELGAALGYETTQIMNMIEGLGGWAGLIAKLFDNDDHKSIAQIKSVDRKRKLFEKYRRRFGRNKINETEYRYLIRSLIEIPTNK